MDTSKKLFNTAFKLESKLYEAIKIFLIISQIFCVAPVGAHQFVPLCHNAWYYFLHSLHFIWCFVVYFCLSSSIYTEYTTFNISLPTIQKPLYFSEYLVYLFHVLFIITVCYYNRTSFGRCIQTLVAIDCKLIAFGFSPCYDALSSLFSMHLWLLVIYAGATASVDYFYSGMEMVSFLRSMTVYLVPNLIISVSMTQYYGLLYGIHLRCRSLTEALQKYQQQYTKDISKMNDPRKIINRLRRILSSLQIFTKEVNTEFSVSILTIYFGSFINISINIFLIYKYVDQKVEINIAWTMYSVIWVAMHVGKMFLILYYNHLISAEKDNIALVLNAIQPHNEGMEVTVRRFLLQLMVDSRAHVLCGLVELNMSFVRSLLENISVLVIFLIQYDVTFEALTNVHSTALTSPI